MTKPTILIIISMNYERNIATNWHSFNLLVSNIGTKSVFILYTLFRARLFIEIRLAGETINQNSLFTHANASHQNLSPIVMKYISIHMHIYNFFSKLSIPFNLVSFAALTILFQGTCQLRP